MKCAAIRQGFLCLAIACGYGPASAQNESGPEPEPVYGSEDFARAAAQYRISTAQQPDVVFELVPKPLLVWSNPERRTASGAVYLYTHQGLPRVAMCIYPANGLLDHEFQSLASEPLLARRDGVPIWAPQIAGMQMHAFEDASGVGKTPFLRLREMRNLSRRFEAEILTESSPKPLRLLSTPVYRYPPEDLPRGVIDGALFSFVQSTDPEVLLLLEAREDAAGNRQWHYGLARMSMVRLRAALDGNEVWKTQWAHMNPTQPYYTSGGN